MDIYTYRYRYRIAVDPVPTILFLEGERKLKNPEKSHMGIDRTCKHRGVNTSCEARTLSFFL